MAKQIIKKNNKKKVKNNKKPTTKKNVVKKNVVAKKKVKIKYKKVLIFLILLSLFGFIIMLIIDLPIKNIYINGNEMLSDQLIIESAKIADYPSSLKNPSFIIKDRLLKNKLIKNAKVYKRGFKIYIDVLENHPLFYNSNINQTVLLNGKTTDKIENIPILINYIPDTISNEFIDNMSQINTEILKRISEIKYNPNEVDNKRFLLTMNDGNYVYLTINKFKSINSYIEIIQKFNNKKGILYLDAGEYFEIFKN